ncbi:hypothetical protein R3I94_007414 [Phoxinus phoxinus]|uniref:Uncharacterized protein n=1 Tax=Phoxinus phoxinus TaxID=58324 RepID=A0AAN9DDB2_9TELE
MLPTDWWIGAHDNRSAVAAVSFCPAFLRREELGRLWQFGKRFNFKVTGLQEYIKWNRRLGHEWMESEHLLYCKVAEILL